MNDPNALPWQPIFPGFSLKLLRGGDDEDTRALLLRVEPGTVIAKHRHFGEVHALNLEGSREILDTGNVIGPGGYVYEPDGNVDSWRATGDVPCIVFVTVRGAMDYLGENGQSTSRSTTRTLTESWRRFLEERHA